MRLIALTFGSLLALVGAVQAAPQVGQGFRLCTGRDDGNYFKAGHILKKRAPLVDPVKTSGSIDNLDKILSGECDGAFVQADALMVYSARNAEAISSLERAGVLYTEEAHLACNRNSGIGRVTDLTKNHRIAFASSGANVTWDAFVMADKKRYEPVQRDARTGVRAFAAAADGTEVQCVLAVNALKSPLIVNDAQANGDRLVLVGTDDWDMGKVAKDARGKAVYGYSEIPAGTYPKIQPSGTVYGTKSVKTITVDAVFVASSKWINANEKAYEGLLQSFQSSKSEIAALTGQR